MLHYECACNHAAHHANATTLLRSAAVTTTPVTPTHTPHSYAASWMCGNINININTHIVCRAVTDARQCVIQYHVLGASLRVKNAYKGSRNVQMTGCK